MRSIRYTADALERINEYSRRYREHFEELFSDTGIWSETQIVAHYREESLRRRQEIFETVEHRLGQDAVLGATTDGTVVLPWRSRFLVISWYDKASTRNVTDIQIR